MSSKKVDELSRGTPLHERETLSRDSWRHRCGTPNNKRDGQIVHLADETHTEHTHEKERPLPFLHAPPSKQTEGAGADQQQGTRFRRTRRGNDGEQTYGSREATSRREDISL